MILRTGGLEIRAKGSISQLSKELASISSFAKLASSRLSVPVKARLDDEQVLEEPTSVEAPVIRVTKSTQKNIRALFETPWGKAPKSSEDISKALEVNAVPDSRSNIAVALIRLVKIGDLRRVKKAGKWTYFHVPT
jgi:hypothetical protein